MKLLIIFLVCSFAVPAADKAWLASLAALSVAQIADSVTTHQALERGAVEANPLARHGLTWLKIGAAGAIIAVERKHHGKWVVLGNLAIAGVVGAVAARNSQVQGTK